MFGLLLILRFLSGSVVLISMCRYCVRYWLCCLCCCCCLSNWCSLCVLVVLFVRLVSVSVVVVCFVVAHLCKKGCGWYQAAGSLAGPKKAKVGWLFVCCISLRKL